MPNPDKTPPQSPSSAALKAAEECAKSVGMFDPDCHPEATKDVVTEFKQIIDRHWQQERDEWQKKIDYLNEVGVNICNERDEARKEVVRLNKEMQEWKDILARRDKHIVDQGKEWVRLKTEIDAMREVLEGARVELEFLKLFHKSEHGLVKRIDKALAAIEKVVSKSDTAGAPIV